MNKILTDANQIPIQGKLTDKLNVKTNASTNTVNIVIIDI